MYLFETQGKGDLSFGLFSGKKPNGFAVGKRWMNVSIAMWQEDIRLGRLWIWELERDYPLWFLDKFLRVRQGIDPYVLETMRSKSKGAKCPP